MKEVVFTDLDGTLLDHNTYSFKKALPALRLAKEKKVPIVICTSKTKAEIEFYRKRLGNRDPFIFENGAAIFIPKDYFKFKFNYNKKTRKYYVIEFGDPYKLKKFLKKIKKKGVKIKGFTDMGAWEVRKLTGLTLSHARLAKKRVYDEAFTMDKKDEKKVIEMIKKKGFNYNKGGRFWHIMGKFDKGKAVKELLKLYKKKYGKIKSYGFGDAKNDFEMLKNVDEGYLVKKPDGTYESNKFKKAEGIGPMGWNKTVKKILR
jgi:mannosyl-3-phosphoglycerate phosphatase